MFGSHQNFRRVSCFFVSCFLLNAVGCGKKKDEGADIGAPLIKPPVEKAAPEGFKSTALTLTASTGLSVMKSRLFNKGPTDIMDRLGQIDERMASINTRSKESKHECVEGAAVEWTPPAKMPDGSEFKMQLQCLDTFGSANSTFQIAFGKKDNVFYLVEIQSGSGSDAPQVASLVQAAADGSSTNAWITMQNFDLSQTKTASDFFFLHIQANDSKSAFEVGVAGKAQGIGLDCGVRVRSSGGKVYGSGIFASFGGVTSETCTGAAATVCASGSTLEEVQDCAAINTFSFAEMTYTSLLASGKSASDALIGAKISGIATF